MTELEKFCGRCPASPRREIAICRVLGTGTSKSESRRASSEELTVSCAQNCNAACFLKGLEAYRPLPNKPVEAEKFFRVGCHRGHGVSCYGLGIVRLQKTSPKESLTSTTLEAAKKDFDRGCEHGANRACSAASRLDEVRSLKERSQRIGEKQQKVLENRSDPSDVDSRLTKLAEQLHSVHQNMLGKLDTVEHTGREYLKEQKSLIRVD